MGMARGRRPAPRGAVQVCGEEGTVGMSRVEEVSRLPVLDVERAAASPVFGRMVFAAGAPADLPRLATRTPPAGIVANGAARLVGNFLAGIDSGVGVLAGGQDFVACLRELLDSPFARVLAEA